MTIDIATEVPSPLTALVPSIPKRPKRILIICLVAAACAASTVGAAYVGWNIAIRTPSQTEVISEKMADLGYFYEPRAQLCFMIDLYHGTGAMVSCEDAHDLINPKIAWLAKYTWYFQDMATEVCYAMVRHPHLSQGSPAPVPCWHIPFPKNISADGHWRYEDLPTTAP
jgi:hypothetical protein